MDSPKRADATGLPFSRLGLAPSLVTALTSLGYEEPTPVQREAIPLILGGRDLIAQADTGTGKTAAFALPMVQRLLGADGTAAPVGRKGAQAKGRTRGLVLVPTRELAMQVAEATHKYARGTGICVVPVYGGAPMSMQMRALDRGADIVVATPGRALDHLRRQSLDLTSLRVLVLDEADEMLDMGFAEDIDAILSATPETRQTALFSATMPPRLRAIAERHLRDPAQVSIAREKTAAGKMPRVRQVAYVVSKANKPLVLQRVLEMEAPTSALVFCRTRLEVDSLVETLNAHGYRADAIHGGMEQRQRDAVMNRFRSAKSDLLIATDVAARGLDIRQLSHVINYDVPHTVDDYVHRIGRTGRAGREGTAITLAEPRQHGLLRTIERSTKQKIEVATVPTVAELRARKLDVTRATLRERILAGDLDDVRVVVESLSEEFDIVQIAAAAVKLAHETLSGQGDDDTRDLPAEPERRDARSREPRESRGPSREPRAGGRGSGEGSGGPMVRLYVGAGRQAGVRPGDLVGAITNEAGISNRELGAIEIQDRFSLIEVPDGLADAVIAAMRKTSLRGQKVTVRRERER
jgi:ATP-dependent RNA helicase DeaD